MASPSQWQSNGIPIFNPIKNDGRTDTQPAGELDVFGGHCGRADDYHSHVAPLHLVDMVGIANLTGYALDRAPPVWTRSTTPPKKYPYVNGGLRGVVEVRDDAITPQPRTMPVRPAGRPLRCAKIIAFTGPGPNRIRWNIPSAPNTAAGKHVRMVD